MSSISSDFKPYVGRFTGYVGDEYRDNVEGRVMGIWNHAGMPHYLVETVDQNGVRRVGIADAVTYLRPAHDFTSVKHNLPEGSAVRTITSCTVDSDGSSYAFVDMEFDNSQLRSRMTTRNPECMDQLNCLVDGGLEDTKDLIGLRVRVDVVDEQLDISLA